MHVRFVYCTWGHLCTCVCVCAWETWFLWVTAGEADVVFQDTPWAPAINDDNLNFDTPVSSWGSHLSNRCHMILMYRGALPLTWQPQEINHHPGITFFWQICSHRPGSRANGLQSISVKDTAPINYSVTCAPILWCYLTIFTVLQEAALPPAYCPWSGELLLHEP